jgi:anti-anti-sigma regulatory factor
VLRRLRNLLVVQPGRPGPASPVGLEAALTAARAHEDAAIVVVDLLDVGELSRSAVDALAFASSHAAVEGQELLIVNASVGTADELRAAGLSATTYVAPEPPLD